MGYAYYDTPLGPAGYSVDDTCHEPDCTEAIDRGLAYLCGDTPGAPDEYGCGKWYCGDHLFSTPTSIQITGEGLCCSCLAAWEKKNPELVAAERVAFQEWLTQRAARASHT